MCIRDRYTIVFVEEKYKSPTQVRCRVLDYYGEYIMILWWNNNFFQNYFWKDKKKGVGKIQTPLKNLNYKISTILGKDQSDGGVFECYQI